MRLFWLTATPSPREAMPGALATEDVALASERCQRLLFRAGLVVVPLMPRVFALAWRSMGGPAA